MHFILPLNLFALFALTACHAMNTDVSSLQRAEEDGRESSTFSNSTSTTHFKVYWNSSETTATEVLAVKTAAEKSFTLLHTFLGSKNIPAKKNIIELEGAAQRPDGSFKYPHVDSLARIHLFRYPGQGGVYEASLTHELVHAFRTPLLSKHLTDWNSGFGFVEEAFAEYVARSVQPIGTGFTNYGYELSLVVGQWIKRDLDVPLVNLIQQHNQLSLKCMIQSYPERASFFFFLESKFGRARLLSFAYQQEPMSTTSFAKTFGPSFDDLATEWRKSAITQYEAIPNAENQAHAYWHNTPAKYFPYCKTNTDY